MSNKFKIIIFSSLALAFSLLIFGTARADTTPAGECWCREYQVFAIEGTWEQEKPANVWTEYSGTYSVFQSNCKSEKCRNWVISPTSDPAKAFLPLEKLQISDQSVCLNKTNLDKADPNAIPLQCIWVPVKDICCCKKDIDTCLIRKNFQNLTVCDEDVYNTNYSSMPEFFKDYGTGYCFFSKSGNDSVLVQQEKNLSCLDAQFIDPVSGEIAETCEETGSANLDSNLKECRCYFGQKLEAYWQDDCNYLSNFIKMGSKGAIKWLPRSNPIVDDDYLIKDMKVCEASASVTSKEFQITLNDLRKAAKTLNQMGGKEPTDLIATVIKFLTAFIGSISLVLYIYAGILWMTAGGNSENVEKAKKVIVWTTLGVAMILASYGLVTFVFNQIGNL